MIKFVSDLQQVGGFLPVLWFPPPILCWPPRYSCNILESGVKHHNPNLKSTLGLQFYIHYSHLNWCINWKANICQEIQAN